MEEMVTSSIPEWLNVTIGFITALGGLELVKYLISLRANRRKDKAQAAQEEASASTQDAEWRKNELELMNQFVETAKQQFQDLKQRYDTLLEEKKEDRKLKQEYRLQLAEHERKIDGLQKAFTESEARRRMSELKYCTDVTCAKRQPPLGAYDSSKIPQ